MPYTSQWYYWLAMLHLWRCTTALPTLALPPDASELLAAWRAAGALGLCLWHCRPWCSHKWLPSVRRAWCGERLKLPLLRRRAAVESLTRQGHRQAKGRALAWSSWGCHLHCECPRGTLLTMIRTGVRASACSASEACAHLIDGETRHVSLGKRWQDDASP